MATQAPTAQAPTQPPAPMPTRTPADDEFFLFQGADVDADALCGEEDGGEDDDDNSEGYSDEDGMPKKKRSRRTRTELNQIEKQRTKRINEQIQSLRALLEASGLTIKKDKFSILKSTSDYVKKLKLLLNKSQAQLQSMVEQQRTRPANELASVPRDASSMRPGQDVGFYLDVDPKSCGAPVGVIQRPPVVPGTVIESGSWAPNKHGVDYSLMFKNASIAMAVASLDGHFVDCNLAFSIISGFKTDEILRKSVFDLTPQEDTQELMSIVGKMMESPAESAKHFWKRCCFENRDCHCFVSMWLVRKYNGDPVFFQCAVLPLEDLGARLPYNEARVIEAAPASQPTTD